MCFPIEECSYRPNRGPKNYQMRQVWRRNFKYNFEINQYTHVPESPQYCQVVLLSIYLIDLSINNSITKVKIQQWSWFFSIWRRISVNSSKDRKTNKLLRILFEYVNALFRTISDRFWWASSICTDKESFIGI